MSRLGPSFQGRGPHAKNAPAAGAGVIIKITMRYDFLIETYETERVKVISAWSMFTDHDLPVRPHPTDTRGRSIHEHMVHQCVSEDIWFQTMLQIDVGAPPLPETGSPAGIHAPVRGG